MARGILPNGKRRKPALRPAKLQGKSAGRAAKRRNVGAKTRRGR